MDERYESDILRFIESGNETSAASLLVEYLKGNYEDEKAWEYLYKTTSDEAMLRSCIVALERINPNNSFLNELNNNRRFQFDRIMHIRKSQQENAEREESFRRTIKVATEFYLDFIYIPEGEFIMGSSPVDDKLAEHDEIPRHKVYLDGYWMGKHPITEAQFFSYMILNGKRPPGIGELGIPIVDMSFDIANEFCAWLFLMTRIQCRLPTEAEWEKAARGTDGRIFPWGDQEPNQHLCNFNFNVNQSSRVGNYSPQGDSPYGCVDMSGNVWEWCSSVYMPYPYNSKDGREASYDGYRGGLDKRVLRGGSGADTVKNIRCAARGWATAFTQGETFGFRVCATRLP